MEKQKELLRYERMGNMSIPKLIPRLAIPSVISMLVTSLYNLADTYFVSSISTSAAGAVGIILPVMSILQAFGMTFGMGAGSMISRLLGAKELKRANETASTAFFSVLMIGTVLAVFGLLFTEPLVRLLGATDTILPHAKGYAKIIFC